MIAVFVIAAAPIQWLVTKLAPSARAVIPRLFHRSLCAIMRVRVQVHGSPSLIRPQLIISNHISWLDIPALGSRFPFWFLAKQEVGAWPIIGFLARLQGCVFVNRNRKRAIPEVNLKICEAIHQGAALVLFPEATTGDGNRLQKFHSPHFEAAIAASLRSKMGADACLQPVTIVYTRRNGLPLDRLTRPSIAWYGDMGLLPHLLEILKSGPIDCELRFGSPFNARGDSRRKALAQSARHEIQAGLASARCAAGGKFEN